MQEKWDAGETGSPWGLPGGGGSAYMSCLPARPQEILPFLCRK